jgi:hypothetical protein
MNNSFTEKSKEIANDFLQTIVFLDDNAYTETNGNSHDFNAIEITKNFSSDEKFCAVYKPNSEDDIDAFIKVAQKADVIILDWEINLSGKIVDAEEAEEASEESDEDDAEVVDTRGEHTKKIINELLENSRFPNSLKLIIVYTGTEDLEGITDNIRENLPEGIDLSNEEICCLSNNNIRIQVSYKGEEGVEKFTHVRKLQKLDVSYDNLPNFVTNEFSKLTSGLLSNFALKALTEVRNNSHKVLSLFNKNLDSAYLAHQSLMPNVEDANELLVDLLKDAIRDLLNDKNLNNFLDRELVEGWVNEHIKDGDRKIINGNGEPQPQSYVRTVELIKNLLFSVETDISIRYKEEYERLNDFSTLTNKQREKHLKAIQKYNLGLFVDDIEKLDQSVNDEFAVLTHHKTFFTPEENNPILSLGSIVKKRNSDKYYVCIQQRCDSVRVGNDEVRRFLFLPLVVEENNGNFNFITPDGERLKLKGKSYNLRTVKFEADENGTVRADKDERGYYFQALYHTEDNPEEYQWLFELKELHAQKIVTDYCANLSRVGINEYEWLRMN